MIKNYFTELLYPNWLRNLCPISLPAKRSESGQVLLVAVMLLAVALTIVLSITFTSRTDTQITKLEEENQKALAAAEAGIEAALRRGNIADFSELNVPSGFTGSATVSTISDRAFVSPLLQKDEQYTFYLSDYPSLGSPYTGTLTVYYASRTVCNNVSLELTAVYDDPAISGAQLDRFIADSGNLLQSDTDDISGGAGGTLKGTAFNCKTSPINIATYSNAKLLIVRAMNSATKVGFEGSGDLKSQGRVITSEARSKTGVTKRVELFQSHPQIPSDFFVTGF